MRSNFINVDGSVTVSCRTVIKIRCLADHKSLECLTNAKEMAGRMARWAMIMSEYNYQVEYIKGVTNTAADALSRLISMKDHLWRPLPVSTHIFIPRSDTQFQTQSSISSHLESNSQCGARPCPYSSAIGGRARAAAGRHARLARRAWPVWCGSIVPVFSGGGDSCDV